MAQWILKVAALGIGASVAFAAVGCSDDEVLTAPLAPQQCGATVRSMDYVECTAEGLECPVQMLCENGSKQVTVCTCVEGAFECKGPDGKFLDRDTDPVCNPAVLPDAPACSGTPASLDNQACPSLRQTCAFPAESCEGETDGPGMDKCTCDLRDDGTQAWTCQVKSCSDNIPLPDAGTDAGNDAGSGDAGDAGNLP